MAYYVLLTTFLLEYIRPGKFFPIIDALKMNLVLSVGVFLVSTISTTRNSSGYVLANPVTKSLLFLIFLVLVSLVLIGANLAPRHFEAVVGYFFIFYAISILVDTKGKLKGVFFILGVAHVIIVALHPELITDPTQRHYITLAAPFLGDGNDFSLSLCLVFPLMVYLFMEEKVKYKKVIIVLCVLVLAVAVVGTQSRGASLAIAGSLLYFWTKSKNKVATGAAIGVVLVVGLVVVAGPQYFARMATLSNVENEGSAQGRIQAWGAAVGMMARNPILGVGAGNFGVYNKNKTAHSIIFLALGELGLPGFLFVMAYVFGNYKRLHSRTKEIVPEDDWSASYWKLFTCLTASLVGFSIAAAFLSCLYYPHIFVLGGIIVAANSIYENDKKERSIDDSPDEEDVKPVKYFNI